LWGGGGGANSKVLPSRLETQILVPLKIEFLNVSLDMWSWRRVPRCSGKTWAGSICSSLRFWGCELKGNLSECVCVCVHILRTRVSD
jgi:hypothetical protein